MIGSQPFLLVEETGFTPISRKIARQERHLE
jgi:hypothetical protein